VIGVKRPDLLVESFRYREYFNPLTGKGYGTQSSSWTAALTNDLVEQMK
jgi:hypothetical protein